MGDLLPLLFLADVAILALALFDCLTTDESDVRNLPKIAWVLLIILFAPFAIGSIMWFVAGRPHRVDPRATHPAGRGLVRPTGTPSATDVPRQLAPDDDPEFLANLSKQTMRADQERLQRWEADLRKREEQLRRNGEPPTDK